MRLPESRAELEIAGYSFSNTAKCRSCPKRIEWWWTPKKRKLPFSVLHTGAVERIVPHFWDCPAAKAYRDAKNRHKARTEKPQPTQGSFF